MSAQPETTVDQSAQKKLTGAVIPREEVHSSEVDRMYELFSQLYLHLDRDRFNADLAEKDRVLLLSDSNGIIQGFTTLKLYQAEVEGKRLQAMFNGNTVIHPEFWGEQELVATWCQFMAETKKQTPDLSLYWFLICSGYRTYMYLPLFFNEFYPRYDREPPAFERMLIDHLGKRKYPREYHNGIIHVEEPRECLTPELAEPPAHKKKNPHVSFFLEQNPGWTRGDELVCIADFTLANTRRRAHQIARGILQSE